MFVDVAKVQLYAGKGGDGAVSFRHEIYIPKGGPDGGDGGRGGSIIFRADKDTNTLIDFRFNPILKAENGKNGAGQRAAGRSGQDLIVNVPVGTVVRRVDAGCAGPTGHKDLARCGLGAGPEGRATAGVNPIIADLTYDGQEAIIAKGGDGGFGNAHFKSSTRQTPRVAELGEPGEAFEAELELKTMADVGLVGLPSAGKSTFLSVVSNATPEIADYPFTTLTPNLGVATVDNTDLLIADIPGLIEGAAEGKGLGHAFLRHIERTAVLLHLVDAYNDDAGAAYQTIRHELEKYADLATRPEIVALTKAEGLDPEIIQMQIDAIKKVNPSAQVFAISSTAHQGITEVLRALKEQIATNKNTTESEDQTSGCDAVQEDATYDTQDGRLETVTLRGMKTWPERPGACPEGNRFETSLSESGDDIPVIKLSPKALKSSWQVEKIAEDTYKVTGEKIEKFARRTDLANYESVNRLRDIMKKLGIRAELTNQGAQPQSIISIADKEFTLVEDY